MPGLLDMRTAPPLAYREGRLPQNELDQRQAQYILNLVSDTITANTITGITIRGGQFFTDTLGGFYPVVIDPTHGVTINGSDTTQGALRFHNTGVSETDEVLFYGNAQDIVFAPNIASSFDTALVVADRIGTFQGWVVYPAFLSGTAHPALQVNDPPGTTTIVFFNGLWHGKEFDTDLFANYARFFGNTAGNQPGIQSLGSDTNIDFQITPKGTGLFSINVSTNAPGGGVNATLGAVGAPGPATSTMNSWLPLRVGATKVWVPVWV